MSQIRRALRFLLRCWYRTGRKLGWHYRCVEALGRRLGEAEPLATRLPNGLIMACNLREQVPRQIYFFGVYEPAEAYIFERLVQPGWTVVDAGANVGQYSLLAAGAVGRAGRVFAFEPVPTTAGLLRANLSCNGVPQAAAIEAALWHQPGCLHLGLLPENIGVSGGFSVGVVQGAREVEAEAIVFDDFADTHDIGRVDLIKMDIEGAELFALRGMFRTLQRDRPLLLMEVCRAYAERLGYRLQDVWDLLAVRLGYCALLLGSSAAECRPLATLEGIEQQNVLFHATPLPPAVLSGWDRWDWLRWSLQSWRRPGRDANTHTG